MSFIAEIFGIKQRQEAKFIKDLKQFAREKDYFVKIEGNQVYIFDSSKLLELEKRIIRFKEYIQEKINNPSSNFSSLEELKKSLNYYRESLENKNVNYNYRINIDYLKAKKLDKYIDLNRF